MVIKKVKKISIPHHLNGRFSGLIWIKSSHKMSTTVMKNIFRQHRGKILFWISELDCSAVPEDLTFVHKKYPNRKITFKYEEIERGVLSEKFIKLSWNQMDWDLPF